MNDQERHYNIHKLNSLFAISCVALLLTLGWLMIDDYSRTWKDYQREFRVFDIEKTRVKYDEEINTLEAQPEYQELVAQMEQAQKDYQANCASLKDVKTQITKLKAENDLLLQEQKFTKARLDAARYSYETDLAHKEPTLKNSQQEYNTLKQQVDDLNRSVERSTRELSEQNTIVEDCGAQLKDVQRKKQTLANKSQILDLKLKKIDPNSMSFINRIGDMARDLPVLDLANPNYKIEQIVLKDITDDVNFMQVPKVDRCITCHLGIANPQYEDAPQPFKTHPKLDIFTGRDSPHPMEEFGCTVCHGGRGRGTDFVSSAHTPSTKDQEKEWKSEHNWEKIHHWEKPMLPKQFVQSSCLKCHSGETVVKEAEKLNLGLHIIEKAGCYSCHKIEKYEGWPKPGPNLTKLASKVSRDWAYRWIQDPQSFRHNTWMPAFFDQSNSNDTESIQRTEQEVHGIVEYIFKKSKEYKKENIPFTGDPVKGEKLVATVGCLGCHQIKPEDDDKIVTLDSLRLEHGPNLTGIGTKASPKWIYNWIKNPYTYHAETKMPSMRLTDHEAADIVSYLKSLRDDEFNKTSIPKINENVVDEIVFGFLSKMNTQRESKHQIDGMNLDDKMMYLGKKLIRHYGCFSCHDIAGFENDKPIGTELTEEGDKSVHKLDFGFVHIDHSNYAWFTQKFKEPRIFDKGKVKAHDEKLRMPNFYFSDEEIEALVTAILGFVREKPEAKIVPRSTKNLYIEDGQKVVRQLNCRGCHLIEGEGGTIQESVKDWLEKYDDRSPDEAEALVTSFSPPNLIGEGRKVKSEWLFNFLHDPETIRPWLLARMPSFDLDASELNILLKYFNALDDQEFPFDELTDTALTDKEYESAQKLFSNDYFDCAKCHIVGDKLPGGSPDSWAPNFALAEKRLKAEWIIEWIMDPQSLLPGTKMPNYFDPGSFDVSGPDDILDGDEHEQIRVLRNYLLTLSGPTDKPSAPKKPEKAPQPAEEAPPTAPVTYSP